MAAPYLAKFGTPMTADDAFQRFQIPGILMEIPKDYFGNSLDKIANTKHKTGNRAAQKIWRFTKKCPQIPKKIFFGKFLLSMIDQIVMIAIA